MGSKEYSTDQQDSWASRRQPETDLQALMETRPGDEPRRSREASQPIADKIAVAMDKLTERQRWIVNATIYEKRPLRAVAEQLGLSKTHVARIRDEALTVLAEVLGFDPDVRRYNE